MRWASSLSRQIDAAPAFAEAAAALEAELEGSAPDLVLLFAALHGPDGFERIAALARRRFPRALLAGCTASGVIGGAREAEEGPALSLTAAVLPGVRLVPFQVDAGARLPPALRPAGGEEAKVLLLAEPFTADVGALVGELDRLHPGTPKFGGLASGGRAPGENRLLVGGAIRRGGAVGVALSGALAVDTLVAQGCRPIGRPMLVTRCRGGWLEALDARPALEVLGELYRSLGARDRELVQHSLFLGLELRPEDVEPAEGELLVRNIVGADEESGAIQVGAELRHMMAVQFVVRDPHSAEEELRRMLARRRRGGARPAGALLFSCVGRGAGLFGAPDHDTGLFEEQLGPAPLGGFFCNGEIGPVGDATFLHGYTSAFALFREAEAAG